MQTSLQKANQWLPANKSIEKDVLQNVMRKIFGKMEIFVILIVMWLQDVSIYPNGSNFTL